MPYTGPVMQGVDVWTIPNPDPSRWYRWLSTKPERLGLWLRAFGDIPGYQLERKATIELTKALAEELGLSGELVDATNRISYGHNVLASIPIEEHYRRVGEQIDFQLEKLEDAEDKFHADAAEIPGVSSFKEPLEVFEDRKRFHTREDRPFSGQSGVGASPALRKTTRRTLEG